MTADDELIRRVDAIAAMAPQLRDIISRGKACDILRALPAAPADPLGAEWMRREAVSSCVSLWKIAYDAAQARECHAIYAVQKAVEAIPAPTEADLDAAALARPKVKALVEAGKQIRKRCGPRAEDGKQWDDAIKSILEVWE